MISEKFDLFSQPELRSQLQREFGDAFDVSGTGQYLVVHPAGQRDLCASRFEQLYRSMLHYYKVRGIKVRRAPLPFVAIVLRTEAEYLRYMSQRVKVDVSAVLMRDIHRASAAADFSSVARIGDVVTKITGGRAPERHEHAVVVAKFEALPREQKIQAIDERIAKLQAARAALLAGADEPGS